MYVEPITKKGGGSDKKIPHEYPIAKQRMLEDIMTITRKIQDKSKIFLDEKIVCIRMEQSLRPNHMYRPH